MTLFQQTTGCSEYSCSLAVNLAETDRIEIDQRIHRNSWQKSKTSHSHSRYHSYDSHSHVRHIYLPIAIGFPCAAHYRGISVPMHISVSSDVKSWSWSAPA